MLVNKTGIRNMVAARTTTSSAFLDVVWWVRILLGRVDVCLVMVFMSFVGVEALGRTGRYIAVREVVQNT